jgi:hypothetical protein
MEIGQNNREQINLINDEISLKELIIKIKYWLIYLKSKLKIIILSGILGGLIGLTIAWFEKPIYKAVLTFAMEEDKGGSGSGLSGALGLASSFGIDLGGSGGGGAFAASNLSALMKSHLIIEKVLLDTYEINGKKTTLAEYYIHFNNFRKKWSKNSMLNSVHFFPGADRTKFSLKQDSILIEFRKELTKKENLDIVQKDKKVTIITIEVNSINEIFSKLFCEALASETSEFYVQTKSKKARMNTNVLQKQADSVRAVLNNNITGVAREADNVFNLNPTLNVKSANSKKIQVDVTANTEVLKQLVVQLELSKITLRKETPLIQTIDRPIFPLDKEKFGKIKSTLLGSTIAEFLVILYLLFLNLYQKMKV